MLLGQGRVHAIIVVQ